MLLWSIFVHNLNAQESCNATITPSKMPLCLLTYYPNVKPVETGETDCLRACKGNYVCYTASVHPGDTCIWDVNGAASFSVANGGKTTSC